VDVFCKNAEWLEDKIGAAIESGQVTREEVEAQIKNYIASGSADGLERDGRDEQVIRREHGASERPTWRAISTLVARALAASARRMRRSKGSS